MFTESIFAYRNNAYKYWHSGNWAQTERAVEVSLGYSFLLGGGRALEIGNVMRPHMRQLSHQVIDLLEQRPNWANYNNEDVLTWEPQLSFDRVLSISTLEHTEDFMRGIKRALSWASDVLITVPLGYKIGAGRTVEDHLGELVGLAEVSILRREIGDDYRWYESTIYECLTHRNENLYGLHTKGATAIAVLQKGGSKI